MIIGVVTVPVNHHAGNYFLQAACHICLCNSDTYCGAAPFDQPEVKAIADYVSSLGNVRGYINFHRCYLLPLVHVSYTFIYVIPFFVAFFV
jgi:hypothetical protein